MNNLKKISVNSSGLFSQSVSFLLALLHISIIFLNSVPSLHNHAYLDESYHQLASNHHKQADCTHRDTQLQQDHSSHREPCRFLSWNLTKQSSAAELFTFSLTLLPLREIAKPLPAHLCSQTTLSFSSRAPPAV
jgi:hypothetical protein